MGHSMDCPFCKLRMKLDRLREEDRAAMHASGTRCWVKDHNDLTNERVVTIVGDVSPAHWRRLLDLLIEIENDKPQKEIDQ